jgi:hypothetical protein
VPHRAALRSATLSHVAHLAVIHKAHAAGSAAKRVLDGAKLDVAVHLLLAEVKVQQAAGRELGHGCLAILLLLLSLRPFVAATATLPLGGATLGLCTRGRSRGLGTARCRLCLAGLRCALALRGSLFVA